LEQEIHSKKNINIVYKISRDVFAMGEGGKNTKNQSYDIFIYERDKSNNEYKLVKTIEKAHSGEITSLCKVMINNNEYLLSGDTGDKLINVYDIQNNFKKVMYLSGHKRKIVNIISLNKINEYKNWIASCSTGLNIKLWDLSEIQSLLSENGNNDNSEPIKGPEIAYSIKGHIKSLKCLYLMSDGTLISNGGDKKLKFWNVDKKTCIKIFDDICVSSTNSICELDNSRIIVGCFNVIKIINVCNLTVENELTGHEVWINCLCITPDGLLYSGDSEGVLSLWEISGEGKKLYTEKKSSAIKTIDLLCEDTIIVGLINSYVDILKYK
jgi:WD40 repeat protein